MRSDLDASSLRVRIGLVGVVFLLCVSILADVVLAPRAAASTGSSVSTPTVTVAPTAAVGARSGYAIAFKTSASGGLSQAASSSVTITFPAGTKVNTLSSSSLTDTTTNKAVGQANPSTTTTLTFFLYSGAVVNGGDNLSAAVLGAINPITSGSSYTVSVSTTADTTPVASGAYSIVAGHPISTPSVALAPTAATGARTGYTIAFNTSTTGGMNQAVGSSVTMTFPAGTKVNALSSSSLMDTTTVKAVGQANSSSTTTITFFLYTGAVVNAGDNLSASIFGVVNPTTASTTNTVSVSTSSDITPVASGAYSIVAGHPISRPSVALAPTAATGARTGYTIAFKTSTTGGMNQAVGSSVTMTFPAGTKVNALSSSSLMDTTTVKAVGQANSSSTTTITFFLYTGAVVNAGDNLSASIFGVVNPTTASTTNTVSVSTSSDITPVTSSSYSIVAGHAVSAGALTPSDHAASAIGVTYTVGLKVSSTGGLSQAVGSTLTMTFPTGTKLNVITSSLLTDSTTHTVVGQANPSTTTSLTFTLYTGSAVRAGDTLSAVIKGAGNPSTTSTTYNVTLSTTSDITPVASCPYYIGAGPSNPCVTSVSPSSGPKSGGSSVTVNGVNFGGATSVKFGTTAATIVSVNAAGTSVKVTTPAGIGTVDVTVTTPAGTSPTAPADTFTYLAPPKVNTASLPSGTVNTPYTATLNAVGGKKPYTWSISSGSLPAGLTLNPATGVISGTPTASGTSTFTVMVIDSESPAVSATKVLSITIT